MRLVAKIHSSSLAWAILATGLRMSAGVLVLPLALRMIPTAQMDLWFVLVAVGNLVLLLDGGLGPTIMRSVSYVAAGVSQLRGHGIQEWDATRATERGGNHAYLKTMCDSLVGAYRTLGLVIGGMLLIGGSGVIFFRNAAVTWSEGLVWAIYVIGIVFTLLAGLWIAICSGLDYVRDAQRCIVFGQVVFLIVAWGGIYADHGLLALSCAYACGALVTFLLARLAAKGLLRGFGVTVGDCFDRAILSAVWPTAWRGITVGLGGFLIVNANTLICYHFLPAGTTSSYGLTLQASGILSSLSAIWLAVKLPTISRLRAKGEIDEVARLFVNTIKKSLGTYLLGALGLLFFGQGLLDLIRSNVSLLPSFEISLLLVIGFLEVHHILYANLVLSENKNPFLLPAITSGACIVLLSVYLVPLWGTLGIIIARGVVQASFNNWWTVWRAIRGLGYTLRQWILIIMGN